MTSASAALTRTSLSLSDLAITGDGTGPLSFTETGVGRPNRAVRNTFADVSENVAGQLLTRSVRDLSNIPFEVIAQGDSAAALDAVLTELDDALFQFTYATTITVGGVSHSWASLPTSFEIVGGSVLSARWAQFFEVVSFTVPVQPLEV